MSVLAPVKDALAGILSLTHSALTALGADPGGGLTWLVCVAVVVVVVRSLLLPITASGVRQAHAAARARPHLRELARRYQGKRDAESLRAMAEERQAIAAEHGMSRLGCLPLLLQIPIWISLYHLLSDVAAGTAVGAMDGGLVASLGTATLVGVPLASRGYAGAGAVHMVVVAGLAVTAALLQFATQRYLVGSNTSTADLPEAMATAQQWVPLLSAGGMLLAGGIVPVALLVYWGCSALWTTGQTAVIVRWFPTPGTPAHARLLARSPGTA